VGYEPSRNRVGAPAGYLFGGIESLELITVPVFVNLLRRPEPVILNVYGAQELIPRDPPAYVAWRAGTITLFLLGS
jgi:hypothetical protein